MRITWHGHAFFELEAANGTTILIDPFMRENPQNDLTPDDLSPDLVAVTHGDFFDHAGEAHLFEVPIVCQSVAAVAYRELSNDQAIDMNVGWTMTVQGIDFTMTHGHHSLGSGRPEDVMMTVKEVPRTREYGGMAGGFVIDDGETKFYHTGDTGLFGDLRWVIGDVYQPDVAAVPIGDEVTMGPKEAAIAVEWLDVSTAIPMHYNAFPRIEQDPQKFVDAVNNTASDADVVVPEVGEAIDVVPPH
jgi:L-ascorbate metabolism protein UlaG (beta-lactamase superfamily)